MHKILRELILADLFLTGSYGLIQPVFAVFMLEGVSGTTITAIGIAATIELVTKSFFQLIVGRWTDKDPDNHRELYALLVGSLLITSVPFFYAFSTDLYQIYILQFVYGLGSALSYPGWILLFMRYNRQDKAAFEWSLYNTAVSLGTAATAIVGAYIAEKYSFHALFIVMGILSLFGTGFIINVFRNEFGKKLS